MVFAGLHIEYTCFFLFTLYVPVTGVKLLLCCTSFAGRKSIDHMLALSEHNFVENSFLVRLCLRPKTHLQGFNTFPVVMSRK